MFAHVKFINDIHGRSACNVPVSHIKSFDINNFDGKTTYEIFWSPNEEDTPDNFTKSQPKEGIPSAGFYKALVLKVAENEEALEQSLEKRRVTIATEKCFKSPEGSSKPVEENKKEIRKKQKVSSAKGRAANMKKICDLKKKCFNNTRTDSFSLFGSDIDTEDSDDDVVPKKMLKTSEKTVESFKGKYNEILQKYSIVKEERDKYKEKCKELKNKLMLYEDLNVKLQQEVISTMKGLSKISNKSSSPVTSPQEEPMDRPIQSCKKVLQFEPQHPWKEELNSPFKYMVSNRPTSTLVTDTNVEENTVEEEGPVENKDDNTSSSGFSKEQLAAAKLNVKFGTAGDSQFAKNLASLIWPPHVLSTRSVSGRSKKGVAEEKKGLTPCKLNYLRGVFRDRLLEENPSISETEQNLRMKNISKYISEKIMTLNRVGKLC